MFLLSMFALHSLYFLHYEWQLGQEIHKYKRSSSRCIGDVNTLNIEKIMLEENMNILNYFKG